MEQDVRQRPDEDAILKVLAAAARFTNTTLAAAHFSWKFSVKVLSNYVFLARVSLALLGIVIQLKTVFVEKGVFSHCLSEKDVKVIRQ